MDLSSLNAVMQRVADIEYRLGMRRRPGGNTSFQSMLDEQMKSSSSKNGNAVHQTAPTSAAAMATPSNLAGAVSSATGLDAGYHDVIAAAAKKYNIDPALVSAVAEVESGFHQEAVSDAGAVGIMQLMPETASTLGVNPYDANQNIDGGAKYLSQLMQSFGGDIRKAVAAYNAGPQAVRDHGGVPPYGETEAYVDSVLDLYK
jgi:soluble lytic murein transglycosylase-like protein